MRNTMLSVRKTILSVCLAATLGFVALPAVAAPVDLDTFTDFESINTTPGDLFDIGTSPDSATFSGDAHSGVAGISELYFSGTHAWMVLAEGLGLIEFETNAATVDFFARTGSGANGDTVITAYDDFNQILDSITLTAADAWVEILFTGSIDHIIVENFDRRNMNSIDDFGYSSVQAVPVPAAIWLFGSGLLGLLSFRRRAVV